MYVLFCILCIFDYMFKALNALKNTRKFQIQHIKRNSMKRTFIIHVQYTWSYFQVKFYIFFNSTEFLLVYKREKNKFFVLGGPKMSLMMCDNKYKMVTKNVKFSKDDH